MSEDGATNIMGGGGGDGMRGGSVKIKPVCGGGAKIKPSDVTGIKPMGGGAATRTAGWFEACFI